MQISPEEIRAQLAEILDSNDFQASTRLKNFLRYIVEETLRGKGGALKAYNIAVDVFDLGENFDPRINPLVRTEAGRLRSKLEHYYLLNPASKIYISIPKGGYGASFAYKGEASAGVDPGQQAKAAPYLFAPQKVTQPDYKATILIMPFETSSDSAEVKHFTFRLINEITVGLTKFQDLRVIDHSRALRITELAPRLKSKLYETQARFVLSGSVQLDSSLFSVWSFLIDAKTGCNLWAEKFEFPFESVSCKAPPEGVAESIVHRIADDFGLLQRTLLKEFELGASASSSVQEAALLYYHWTTVLTKRDFEKALHCLEKSLQNEPQHALTRALLAELYASDYQWSYDLVEYALDRSLHLAMTALSMDPDCQVAHLAMALNYCIRGNREEFVKSAERAISVNPSSTNVLSAVAAWYGYMGCWEKSMELTQKALSLSSASPGWCYSTIAMYHYMHDDYAACLAEAKKVHMTEMPWSTLLCLAAGAVLHEQEECARALAELLEVYPDFKKNGDKILARSLPREIMIKMLKDLEQAGLTFTK